MSRVVLNVHDGMETLVIEDRSSKPVVRWMVTGYIPGERQSYIEAEVTDYEADLIVIGYPMDVVLEDVLRELRHDPA